MKAQAEVHHPPGMRKERSGRDKVVACFKSPSEKETQAGSNYRFIRFKERLGRHLATCHWKEMDWVNIRDEANRSLAKLFGVVVFVFNFLTTFLVRVKKKGRKHYLSLIIIISYLSLKTWYLWLLLEKLSLSCANLSCIYNWCVSIILISLSHCRLGRPFSLCPSENVQ